MKVVAWYLHGIDYEDAPTSLQSLKDKALRTEVSVKSLTKTTKWEHLLQGKASLLPSGWVALHELATTRRGIATGSNSFFLISRMAAAEAGIRTEMLRPCIGRAADVPAYIFSESDFSLLENSGARTLLVDFRGDLSSEERRYVKAGEEAGLRKRYLLAGRTPWYSMEQRPVAPLWAAVLEEVI